MICRLLKHRGGFVFAWFIEAPIAGIEGLPVEHSPRAWRPFVYRRPTKVRS